MKNVDIFYDKNSVYIRVSSESLNERDEILKKLTDLILFDKVPEELNGIDPIKPEKPKIPKDAKKVLDIDEFCEEFKNAFLALRNAGNREQRLNEGRKFRNYIREFDKRTEKTKQTAFLNAFSNLYKENANYKADIKKSKTDDEKYRITLTYLMNEHNGYFKA